MLELGDVHELVLRQVLARVVARVVGDLDPLGKGRFPRRFPVPSVDDRNKVRQVPPDADVLVVGRLEHSPSWFTMNSGQPVTGSVGPTRSLS